MKRMYLRCLSILLLTMLAITSYAQQKITGTVKDSSGPFPGASVSVKGTSRATQTDANGNFTITAQLNETLVFTAVGYKRTEVPINNQSSLNITLIEDANALNDVVVTALGVKRDAKALG